MSNLAPLPSEIYGQLRRERRRRKDKKRKGPKRRELGCEERARAHEGEKGYFVKSASGAKQTARRTEIRRVEYKTKEEPL